MLERRLIDLGQRIKRISAELAVVDEQAQFLAEEADDARLRALVSETPMAQAEARESGRHADALARRRDDLTGSIEKLRKEQDGVLDRMAADGSAR